MNGIASRLAELLSRALEPNERDALHGDHAELNVSGAQALHDVLGLVIRRQLEAWKNWRPWIAVISGILPFLVYGVVNIQTAHGFSKISPIDLLTKQGPSYSGWIFIGSLLPLGGLGSWACGFVVSSFSKGARGVNLALLVLVWLLALAGLSSPLYEKTWDGHPFRLLLALASTWCGLSSPPSQDCVGAGSLPT